MPKDPTPPLSGKKRTFVVTLLATATVTIDQAAIDVVNDEWRSHFYRLQTPEAIAEHLAYNAAANGADIHELDGFAHLTSEFAHVELDWDGDYETEETTANAKIKRTRKGKQS